MWPCFSGAYDGLSLAGQHAGRGCALSNAGFTLGLYVRIIWRFGTVVASFVASTKLIYGEPGYCRIGDHFGRVYHLGM